VVTTRGATTRSRTSRTKMHGCYNWSARHLRQVTRSTAPRASSSTCEKRERRVASTPSVVIRNLLQRRFTVTCPNIAWVTGITYIRTWQGWLYLAVVLDLVAHKIVGWSAGPTIHREVVLNAVLMAVRDRRPRGALIHSDQGPSSPATRGADSAGSIRWNRA
jgi:transposase InsO family protein